jgi:hypothetical protein
VRFSLVMSWPGPSPCVASDDALPPNVALELLRHCLTLPTAPWTPHLNVHTTWSACTSTAAAFQDAIGWLGLELILKQRHMRLCASLVRQEENKVVSLAGDGSHRWSGGLRAYQSRKRSRDAAKHTIQFAVDESIELRATQLRPRALRATGASSRPGGIVDWIQQVERNRDMDAVMEFLGLAGTSQLLRCVYAVGAVAMWGVHGHAVEALSLTSLLRVLTSGSCDGAPSPTPAVCWTAAFVQTLYQPPPLDAPGSAERRVSPLQVDKSSAVHIEGVVQLLFPSEATATFINVFVAPALAASFVLPPPASGSVRGAQTRGTKLREKLAVCCGELAPLLSRGAFGGLDVPRGAKYYPAARKLQLLWMERYKSIFTNARAGGLPEDDSDGGSSSDASA